MNTRVLISGGGIAGLSLGFWLKKFGIEPLVIDRAAQFQPLGHYIAVKGNGVEVLRQMGLENACREQEVKFSQALMMSSSGKFLRMGSRTEFDQTLGGYILFRRSDLHAVIYESVSSQLEIRYGTQIESIQNQEHQVEVTLSNGSKESFDYVFGADGIHSKTRKLVFGEGFEYPMGGWYIALTEQYAHRLDLNLVRTYLGTGQSVFLMPTSPNHISAIVYHSLGGLEPQERSNSGIRQFLLQAYREFAPEVTAFFSAMNEHSFIFMDTISQVGMPSIVRGRVALVGDAAHCPTFMSGMGSSLAMQGAQLLASSLQQNFSNPTQALSRYEAKITPIADGYRKSALQMKPLLLSRRPAVAFVRNLALRILPDWVMEHTQRKFYQAEHANQPSKL